MKALPLFLAALVATRVLASAQEAAPATTPAAAEPTPAEPAAASAFTPESTPAPAPEAAPATTPTVPAAPAPEMPATTTPGGAPAPDASLDLVPAQPGQLLPMPSNDPALIPDAPQQSVPPVKAEKKSKTAAVEEEFAQRVRFRQAETRVRLAPDLQEKWEKSERVRTDYEKREILKDYYKNFYGRIRKLDRSLTKEADAREELALRRLEQRFMKATEAPTSATESSSRGIISTDTF